MSSPRPTATSTPGGSRRSTTTASTVSITSSVKHHDVPIRPRRLAALRDAVRPNVRVWISLGRSSSLPQGGRVGGGEYRIAADADAAGRCGDFPVDHDECGPVRTLWEAGGRGGAEAGGGGGGCGNDALLVAGRGDDDRGYQSERQRGRTVSADRAGGAVATGAGRTADPDSGLVQSDGIAGDGN